MPSILVYSSTQAACGFFFCRVLPLIPLSWVKSVSYVCRFVYSQTLHNKGLPRSSNRISFLPTRTRCSPSDVGVPFGVPFSKAPFSGFFGVFFLASGDAANRKAAKTPATAPHRWYCQQEVEIGIKSNANSAIVRTVSTMAIIKVSTLMIRLMVLCNSYPYFVQCTG